MVLLKKIITKQNISAALILLGLSGLILSGFLMIKSREISRPPAGVSQAGAPSDKKPTQQAISSYSVAADLPKYIDIPTIKVAQSRIVGIGLKNNQISSPDNIYDAGWYRASSKPGQGGAMFIFGHVSSWTANGLFYDLKKLKPGDLVNITRGDNKTFSYKVVNSKIYPADKVNMDEVLAPVNDAKYGLNLMTCTGSVIKGTSDFSERLVVFTKPA